MITSIQKFRARGNLAFTLIELLVVITIIGILASIAIPVFGNAQRNAVFIRALAEARGIGLALAQYANDNDGRFPLNYDSNLDGILDAGETTPVSNSNQAFRMLLAGGFINRERVFAIQGDPWITVTVDDRFKPLTTQALRAGENSYAYVRGLTNISDGAWPLMANAFAGSGGVVSNPQYAATGLGGVFQGRKCIVIRVDGSAEKDLKPDASFVVNRPGTAQNFFVANTDATDPWLTGAVVLNPQ
jgi:prepilin-type N-terminal cleavage/methylation domain-containing protein